MIQQITKNGLTWFELDLKSVCFMAFDLESLLFSLPTELKNQCLTKVDTDYINSLYQHYIVEGKGKTYLESF